MSRTDAADEPAARLPAAVVTSGGNTRLATSLSVRRRELAATAIEEAALELFGRRPMEDVTVEQIAVAAGVSVRSFYRYFGSKEEIFTGYPKRRAQEIAAGLAGRPAGEAPFEALRNTVGELALDGNDNLRRWQAAVAATHAGERMSHLVVAVSSPILTEALAARAGTAPGDLWPSVAGSTAAHALVIGARRWQVAGGSLRDHMLAPLDLLIGGLGQASA
jgi:AcrR family transcriptional regulator